MRKPLTAATTVATAIALIAGRVSGAGATRCTGAGAKALALERAAACVELGGYARTGNKHAPVKNGQHVIGKFALHFNKAEMLLDADCADAAASNAAFASDGAHHFAGRNLVSMGNALTGVSLGLKSFWNGLEGQRARVEALLNIGATPEKVLFPFVCQALETALVPTLNSMLGMGIVVLPGMMTGQILSGTAPTTAILYQITIMVAICACVCLCCFCSLYFGYRTLWNAQKQVAF